jgi:hypothetical protein
MEVNLRNKKRKRKRKKKRNNETNNIYTEDVDR